MTAGDLIQFLENAVYPVELQLNSGRTVTVESPMEIAVRRGTQTYMCFVDNKATLLSLMNLTAVTATDASE